MTTLDVDYLVIGAGATGMAFTDALVEHHPEARVAIADRRHGPVGDVVRLGHLRAVERGRLELDDGSVRIADDAVVVHCAAEGLRNPPLVPVWRPDVITLQPIRAGFPCFAAALTGYVEATRTDDDEKNRLCPPSPYGNSLRDWAAMNVHGTRAGKAFSAEPDVREWANGVALNPARVQPGQESPALDDARERLASSTAPGLARLAELM